MNAVTSHRELIVWQKSMDLALQVYKFTQSFPATETYGLTAQIKRAVSSVPANIAEGNARGTGRDYAHFLSIAKGSLMETETFLLLAVKLDYISMDQTSSALGLIIEIAKMLTVIRNKLNTR